MPAVYEFRFSEDFLVEALRRLWRHKRQRTFAAIRLVASGIMAMFAVLSLGFGQWWLALFFALLILAAYQGRRLDEWLARRRFRKSPYYDDPVRVEVSDDGLWIKGLKSDTRLTWEAFSRAVRFPDGWLLLQGPGVGNWLPDAARRDGESNESLDELVQRRDGVLEIVTATRPMRPAGASPRSRSHRPWSSGISPRRPSHRP